MIGRLSIVAAIAVTCILPASPAAAEPLSRTYLHRSRGSDLRAVKMTVTQEADGSTRYTTAGFPSGRYDSDITLLVGADGKPVEYVSAVDHADGFRMAMAFTADSVVFAVKMPGKPEEEHACAVRPGSLPDLNSRPDPYLTQHLLIRAYDFAKGGKQEFNVYDVDNIGKGLSEYQVSLELVDEDGVDLPNGKFKARHLHQVQQSSAPTWYKKRRGSRTDIWANEEGAILRIYRHREPYELILQDYDKPGDLIARPEAAATEAPVNTHGLPPAALHLCASVDLGDPEGGGTVNYLRAPGLSPGGFVCNVGPVFTMPQASDIDLAVPYEGGAVTTTHTGLRLIPSSLTGITDIRVPMDGKTTMLSYRLTAMPEAGQDKTFGLYFYPSFPGGRAAGWGQARVRRVDDMLLFAFGRAPLGEGPTSAAVEPDAVPPPTEAAPSEGR